MNVNNMVELVAALITLEGTGVASCWQGEGEYSLSGALEKYHAISTEDRAEMTEWYECIYGNGGWSRYFLNLKTGEVTFSAFHSYSDKIKRAQALGFNLH